MNGRLYIDRSYCWIETPGYIVSIIIKYHGSAIITDKTNPPYFLSEYKNYLIIKPWTSCISNLQDLFEYDGRLILLEAWVVLDDNSRAKRFSIINKFQNNIIQSMINKFEDMDSLTFKELKNIPLKNKNFKLIPNILENLKTNGKHFTLNDNTYKGMYHQHLDGKYKNMFMTGATHDMDSKILKPIDPRSKLKISQIKLTKSMQQVVRRARDLKRRNKKNAIQY